MALHDVTVDGRLRSHGGGSKKINTHSGKDGNINCPHKDRKHHAKGMCLRCYQKKWFNDNKPYVHAQRKYCIYGVSPEIETALVAYQDGVCAVCKKDPGPRGFVVDHDHTTGETRGLLCNGCNIVLCGIDDAEFLATAKAYIADPPMKKIKIAKEAHA